MTKYLFLGLLFLASCSSKHSNTRYLCMAPVGPISADAEHSKLSRDKVYYHDDLQDVTAIIPFNDCIGIQESK